MSLKMNEILRLFKELVWSFGGVSRGVSTMSCLRNIPPADGPTGSHKLYVNRNFQGGSFKMLYKTHFDHNFSRPARIELKFCTVAKLEELNNFCLDQNEGYPWKKVRFRDLRLYLARARARARARPSRAGGLRPLPRKGTGDLPDGARAFIFDRSSFRNWPVQVIRRFFILLEIEYVNATEGKSKELKYVFIWPIFWPSSLTIYNVFNWISFNFKVWKSWS